MEEVGKRDPSKLEFDQLAEYANQFSEGNFLGKTQFGKLYRGKIRGLNQREEKEVTVKIWEDPAIGEDPWAWWIEPNDKKSRLKDEVFFLQHPSVKNHPNLVKLIGHGCKGEHLGVVYDLNPRDTLHNLMLEVNFTWLQRIKVAIGFARLLDFLHNCKVPYMVRNIDAAHIMIDQDSNPILFEFGMLSGGIMGNMAQNPDQRIWGAVGYIDLHLVTVGVWSVKCDVYSFGVILLSLIAKRVVDKAHTVETMVDEWAKKEYKPKKKSFFSRQAKCSLVHKSFEEDPVYDARDGPKITALAMSCLEFCPKDRPTMKEIIQRLHALHVVQSHGETSGIKPIIDDA